MQKQIIILVLKTMMKVIMTIKCMTMIPAKNSSDMESFHDEMDWYHVLEYHESYTNKKK